MDINVLGIETEHAGEIFEGSEKDIIGYMKNVGYHISDTTVGNVLKNHGIEPAPDREKKPTWKDFLSAHWAVMGVWS